MLNLLLPGGSRPKQELNNPPPPPGPPLKEKNSNFEIRLSKFVFNIPPLFYTLIQCFK